jgi:hypothetical protein
MPFSVAAKNSMLNGLKGTAPGVVVTHAAIYDGNPGPNGASANQIGDRLPIAFNDASGANLDSSNVPEFPVPGGATVGGVAFWTAAAGGICAGGDAVAAETYTNAGTYRLTDADLDLLDA